MLLVREVDAATGEWDAMVRPSRRLSPGTAVALDAGGRHVVVREATSDGLRRVILPVGPSLEELGGELPLPPYVREELRERERYQTVYGQTEGSVAAPTAGLHFTSELLERIEAMGVSVARVTLHVGPGTFRPVQDENPRTHQLGMEVYGFPADAAETIWESRAAGGRVICVGTTTVRVLETVHRDGSPGDAEPASGSTSLFILPGFEFRATDAMVTNFHLPRSTLLMLVAAFAGKDFVDLAYRTAVRDEYRFYSFGDAMLIL